MSKNIAADRLLVGGVEFLHGAFDPSAIGQAAAIGSFFADTTTGSFYRKADTSDLDWVLYGGTVSGSTGWYGSAVDGDVTLPVGITTLARDGYWGTLTVPNGAILAVAGFRILCRVALIVEAGGIVRSNGTAAVGQPGGAAAVSTGPLGASGAGGNGGASGAGSTGGSATGRPQYLPSGLVATSGRGGTGGTGSAGGGAGGASISFTSPAATPMATPWFPFGGVESVKSISGGTGGGGGSGGGAGFPGGGGGGGGGVISIAALTVQNDGAIEALGGAGGSPPSAGNAGGGGGGGGGRIWVITNSFVGNALDIAGGAGGAGSGTGTNGSDGYTGYTWMLPQ